MKQKLETLLQEFHDKLDKPSGKNPRGPQNIIDSTEIRFRVDLITEEYNELKQALLNQNPENILKESCDLIYITVGTLVRLGIPFHNPFLDVHKNNLTKFQGTTLRDDGKLLKNKNYKKVNLSKYVERHKPWLDQLGTKND